MQHDHRHVSALPYRQSWRNFRNVVGDLSLRWRNSVVVLHNATNVTVERTRTREHIWITWRAPLSRRPLLERPLLGEIEKDDPSVRKIRTYMLREVRVPFVYPIPPQCHEDTRRSIHRAFVYLPAKTKPFEQGRVGAMTEFDEFRSFKIKKKNIRGNKRRVHFFLIRFGINS